MKISFILETNKEIGLRNIINNYLWFGKDIEKGILEIINRYDNMMNIEYDMNINEIKQYIRDYYISLEDKKNFNNFIKRLKSYYCNRINNEELLKEEGIKDYFNSVDDLYNFIVSNIIPVAKSI